MGARQLWIGLDVGELTANICVYGNAEVPELEVATGSSPSEIMNALSRFPRSDIEEIIVESGADQGLTRFLVDLGFPVTVVDARKAHKFLTIRSNKTDKNDARGLADIARLGRSKSLSVWVHSAEFEMIRSEFIIRD